jgi:hypothetical protein
MRQLSWKELVMAAFLFVVGIAAASPALADYAVVQFDDGFCRVWWDSAGNPWGTGWTKLAIGLPNYGVAEAVLDEARMQGACR